MTTTPYNEQQTEQENDLLISEHQIAADATTGDDVDATINSEAEEEEEENNNFNEDEEEEEEEACGGATSNYEAATAANGMATAASDNNAAGQYQEDLAHDLNRFVQAAAMQRGAVPTAAQQAQALHQYQQLQYQAAQQALAQQQAQQQQQQTQLTMEMEDPEDSDDEGNGRSEKRAGRRKIRIEYIEDKSRRHITFSKRKAGIMKKAYELSTLTGTQVLLLVASETGHVYTFATPKLQPLITKPEGKNLIQACLNAPDGDYGGGAGHQHSAYDDDGSEDRPNGAGASSANLAAMSQNYAAAMAGLAGYQYPTQGASNAATAAALAQAYMSQAAHYPAYAAQYNAAAAAAGYWPQTANAAPSTPQAAAAAMAQQQQQHQERSTVSADSATDQGQN